MDILGIAQQGLSQSQGQFSQAAQRIANLGADAPAPSDTVSLSDNMVSLMTSKNQVEADLGVAHTAQEMQKKTLDLLA
jgi:flagellar basal body rod protein FlgC